MDVSLFIRHRLTKLGLDQKQLAAAAQVTDSYISQLLARKKTPPAPGRTDLYERIGQFLQLPTGTLEGLAVEQRQQELKRKVLEAPRPLFKDFRELILRKCAAARRNEVRRIFEKDAFGELERLVTQTVLDVARGLASDDLRDEVRLRSLARRRHASYQQARVTVLEFLDTDILGISPEHCATFIEPAVAAWDIDLRTFAIDISPGPVARESRVRRFEFTERAPPAPPDPVEPGLEQFLADPALRGDATPDEIEFLRRLRFAGRRPAALYYYRELQNLRDPLHFPESRKP